MPGHSPYTLSSLTIIPFFAPDTHGLSTRPIQLSKNKADGNSDGINRLENVEHSPQLLGGADWNRTSDPLLAKQVLSQLSYSPAPVRISVRVNPLIGNPVITTQWWAWIELNYRPRAYQARALTN
jgi:hypothetical protein